LSLPAGKSSYGPRDCNVDRIRYFGFDGADSVTDLGERVGAFTKMQKFTVAGLSNEAPLELNLISSSRAYQQKLSLNVKLPIAQVQ
jgi:hypothetical protein